MIMTGQPALSRQTAFQGMAALVLDVGFFTSQFRLCDKIAEYLGDLVAQSHEDPARYANFTTSLINEVIELAFRSVHIGDRVEFNLLKGDDSVCLRVGFRCSEEQLALLRTVERSRGSPPFPEPARDLMALAHAVGVDVHTEIDGADCITLTLEFVLSEGPR